MSEKLSPDAQDWTNNTQSEAADLLRRTEELFHRAMELPADVRVAQVSAWTENEPHIRESVLALLAADSNVQELISADPPTDWGAMLRREVGEIDGILDMVGNEEAGNDPWIGRVLGAFRLDRLLGRGGMGVVYLGERVTGGFRQKVAVKLIGWHMRSAPAVEQFLLERETLARLEHRNIARLLDGGVTGEGFPYVVMEYIEGRRLDEACDDPATSIEQTIRWMLQLCHAVTYAHRNLVLHRDLKPGNVMVTADGVVKLLDFGTLKRIGSEGETDSAMTRAGMRPITMRYASPEHIEGSNVSTASDVYSLGMILYRIIAGKLPAELNELTIGRYLDRLRQSPYKPPSEVRAKTRFTTKAATMRPRLASERVRDLDSIVDKAIRFEPEFRYPTAEALAEDLMGVLEDRPISARTGNFSYRAGKFWRRNRWPVLAGAALLIVLVTGTGVMLWQGHKARTEEQRAQRGIEDERKLAHMLLFDYVEQLNTIPGSIDAQRKAVADALQYLDGLSRIAPDEKLELDIIRGYTDMGNLLGNPYNQNLGNVPEAIKALEKGQAMAQRRLGRDPRDLSSLNALAAIDRVLGGLYLGNGDPRHAEQILQEAAAASAAMDRNPHVTAEMLQLGAAVTDVLGDVYDPGRGWATASLDKAVQTYLQSNAYDDKCRRLKPDFSLCRVGVIVGEYKLGMLIEDPNPAMAEQHYQKGLGVLAKFSEDEKKLPRSSRLQNYLLSRQALMEMRLGQMAEGEADAVKAQAGFRDAIAKAELDNRARFDMAAFETDLATEYHRQGMDQAGAETSRELLKIMSVLLQRSPKNVRWQMIQAQDLMTAGRIEDKLGHKAQSQELIQHGLTQAVALAKSRDASPEALDLAADGLLEFHPHPDDAAVARGFAQRAVESYARPTAAQWLTLAHAQASTGSRQEAAQSAQKALAELAGPVESKLVADQIANARRLSQFH
jgi:non-specific serine/threonine protein kinase/serine/threonine-protein kinase